MNSSRGESLAVIIPGEILDLVERRENGYFQYLKTGHFYFDIECPFMKGGHYVRRGHCHVEYEGVKKASCYTSGNGDEGHASRGREGIRVNGSTDPQDY